MNLSSQVHLSTLIQMTFFSNPTSPHLCMFYIAQHSRLGPRTIQKHCQSCHKFLAGLVSESALDLYATPISSSERLRQEVEHKILHSSHFPMDMYFAGFRSRPVPILQRLAIDSRFWPDRNSVANRNKGFSLRAYSTHYKITPHLPQVMFSIGCLSVLPELCLV